jgi:hypothetical protein
MHTERRKDALIGSGIHQFIGLARDHVDAGAGFLEYALPIRWGP